MLSPLMQPLTQLLQLLPHVVCQLSAFLQTHLRQQGPTATQQQQRLVTTGITCKHKLTEGKKGCGGKKKKKVCLSLPSL